MARATMPRTLHRIANETARAALDRLPSRGDTPLNRLAIDCLCDPVELHHAGSGCNLDVLYFLSRASRHFPPLRYLYVPQLAPVALAFFLPPFRFSRFLVSFFFAFAVCSKLLVVGFEPMLINI